MGVKDIKCLIEGCEKYFSEKGNMIIHYKRHLMKVKGRENENGVDVGVDEALTRPESNVTLVNEEGKKVEMDLTFDVYDDVYVDDDAVEFIEDNVNVDVNVNDGSSSVNDDNKHFHLNEYDNNNNVNNTYE
jgi:hypothetical protein